MSLLDEIYESEHLICKGLKEINDKGELNKETLSMMGELVDMAKDVFSITMHAEYPEYSTDNYSRESYSGNDYSMRGDYSMRDGYSREYDQSYMRRRDSRGRYSRGYGRDGMNDEIIAMLEDKMKSATNEQDREKYRRKIIEMENS